MSTSTYEPMKRKDGRWEFVHSRRDMVEPIGYCEGWENVEERLVQAKENKLVGWPDKETFLEHKEDFHEQGHESALEAASCYKKYLLDFHLNVEGEYLGLRSDPVPCRYKGCGEKTKRMVTIESIPRFYFPMCLSHRKREAVEETFDLYRFSGSY